MRRFLLGVQLLGLLGAAAGAALTWPKGVDDPAMVSPTLSDFQTGVRVSLLSDAAKQTPPAPAVQTERKQRDGTRVAASPAHAMDETGQRLDADWTAAGRINPVASIGTPQQLLSAGENVPAAVLPRPPPVTAVVPRLGELLRQAVLLASAEPAQAMTLPVVNTPEPDVPTYPAWIAGTAQQGDLVTENSDSAAEIAKPPARNSNDSGTNDTHRALMTVRHVEHISIHYHSDSQSRTDAQHISGKLGSSGLSAIEMHTTAHIMPIPLVRYFSQRDAAAAILLAKGLGGRATDWHVDDCTTYQHKPGRGTIEIWPATARTSQ